MRESIQDPMQRPLTSTRRITAALLPEAQRPSTESPLAGHLCEVCLDAPATRLQPAPWGGEMGVCAACGGLDPVAALAVPTGECARHPLERAHSPMPSRHGTMI
jgi:hypothetical protein